MRALTALAACFALLLVAGSLTLGLSWRVALSNALVAGGLFAAMQATRANGWRLVWILAALYGGIGPLNIALEAMFFHIMPMPTTLQFPARGLTLACAASLVVVAVAGRLRLTPDARTRNEAGSLARGWPWRLAAVALCYVVLYFMAGILVFPYVAHFYAGRPMPSPRLVVLMQLGRGLVYALVMLPFSRSMVGRRWRAGLVLGLCLSVFGGIAPLLLPNEYLPAEILPFHMIEVGISNFLFGVAAALLLVGRVRAPSPSPHTQLPRSHPPALYVTPPEGCS